MINFPYPATNGQIYTTGTLIYVYNATQQSWLTQPSSSATFTAVSITGNIASVSTNTGALTVLGGVGITGALYAGAIYSNGALLGQTSNTATNSNSLLKMQMWVIYFTRQCRRLMTPILQLQ